MARPENLVYLSDYRDPEDEVNFHDEYTDLWVAVLRATFQDYWRGQALGQHLKGDCPVHATRRDARKYQTWKDARDWLLSKDTSERTFLWLMSLLKLDPDTILARMNKPELYAGVNNQGENL